MNYYIDTEFLEGKQKEKFPINLFRRETPNTIDLISIGIVSEDDREYYAIGKDFNLYEAWNRFQMIPKKQVDYLVIQGIIENEYEKEYWIRENVLKPIFFELAWRDFHSTHFKDTWLSDDVSVAKNMFIVENISDNYKWFKKLINKYGKSNTDIAKEIRHFVANRPINDNKEERILDYNTKDVKFYAYYADYDWVEFCWLFGKRIDLPDGFPQYCIDLKQTLDERVNDIWITKEDIGNVVSRIQRIEELSFDKKVRMVKGYKGYPKPTNEHNAISAARWNRELHEFIKTL